MLHNVVTVQVWGNKKVRHTANPGLDDDYDDCPEYGDMAFPDSDRDSDLLESDVSVVRIQSTSRCVLESYSEEEESSNDPDEEMPSQIWVARVEDELSELKDGDHPAYVTESDDEPLEEVESGAECSESGNKRSEEVESDTERSASTVLFFSKPSAMPLTLGFLASPRQRMSPVQFHYLIDKDNDATVSGTTFSI